MQRTLLPIINVVIAVLTITLASMSLVVGIQSSVYNAIEIPDVPALDSNLRFFGGLGLGLGLSLLWISTHPYDHIYFYRSAACPGPDLLAVEGVKALREKPVYLAILNPM